MPNGDTLAAANQGQRIQRQFHYGLLASYFAFNFGCIQSYGRVHVFSLVSVAGVD